MKKRFNVTRHVIHPMTAKALKKGHPWVTADRFSLEFDKKADMIVALDNKKRELGLLINDPEHNEVLARTFSNFTPTFKVIENFPKELEDKLLQAFNRRLTKEFFEERDNVYLTFGEVDFLPGLYILKVGHTLIIQSHIRFWVKQESLLLESLSRVIEQSFTKNYGITLYFQDRTKGSKNDYKKKSIPGIKNSPIETEFEEYGVKYSLDLSEKDLGHYTDMASIRKKIAPHYREGQSLLNLFSFTGAFSVHALKCGLKKVVSVDLAKKHLQTLHDNLEKNGLDSNKHEGLIASVDEALDSLIEQGVRFHHIICDPPSFSNDFEKSANSFRAYNKLIPKLIRLLDEGGQVHCFLNNHGVLRKKFDAKIESLIPNSFEIKEKYKMAEDCIPRGNFPESDYLKGLRIGRKNP